MSEAIGAVPRGTIGAVGDAGPGHDGLRMTTPVHPASPAAQR